jgi:thymidine kinase
MNGSIELIIGPMFAGKTTELLRCLKRHKISKKRCLLIKAEKDKRYSENNVSSHDAEQMTAITVNDLFKIENTIFNYDVIGIDEGQFFSNIKEFSEYCANNGKIVIISALDGDYLKKPFGQICEMIPLCEFVKKLSAICMKCHIKDAYFTKRICIGNELEIIGGTDKYIAICRQCNQI